MVHFIYVPVPKLNVSKCGGILLKYLPLFGWLMDWFRRVYKNTETTQRDLAKNTETCGSRVATQRETDAAFLNIVS